MKRLSILLFFVPALGWSTEQPVLEAQQAKYDLSGNASCQLFSSALGDEASERQFGSCSKSYSAYLYKIVSTVTAKAAPGVEAIPGLQDTLGLGAYCLQKLETDYAALASGSRATLLKAQRANGKVVMLKDPHPEGGTMLNSTEGAYMIQEGLTLAGEARSEAAQCLTSLEEVQKNIPKIPDACTSLPKSSLKLSYDREQMTLFENRKMILQSLAFAPFGAERQRFEQLRANVVKVVSQCRESQSLASIADRGLRQAQVVARQSTTNPQTGGGFNLPQTPEKRGLVDSAKNKAGQALPGALGAMMAGAGMLDQPKAGGDSSRSGAQPEAPKTEAAQATASRTPSSDTSSKDAAAAEEPKVATGSSDVTKQSPLVKLSSGKVIKQQILDKDGNVIGEELVAHDANGSEVKNDSSDNSTIASGNADTLGSAGADAPLGAVGSGGAEASGVALASGPSGGSGGPALASDTSQNSQGYAANSPYSGVFHNNSSRGGGFSGGQGVASDGGAPLDSNLGTGYASGGESSGSPIQTVAARKSRRSSALPICSANSKANATACQPIQRLRDDRIEREKGRINSDPNLNIESGRTRKR